MKSQTGTIFCRYEAVAERLRRFVDKSDPKLPGCDKSEVRARLVQRLVELTADHFADDVLAHGGVEAWPAENDLRANALNGISWTDDFENIRPDWRRSLAELRMFVLEWGYMLVGLLRGAVWPRKDVSRRVTLFLDLTVRSADKAGEFTAFCAETPIEPIRDAEALIVQAPFTQTADARVRFSPRPLHDFLAQNCRRATVLKALAAHFAAPFVLIRAIATSHLNVLLARDIAMVPAFSQLNRDRAIDQLVVTLSRFRSQPLSMHGLADQQFPLHMIWYSQNSIPKVYRDENVASMLPAVRHMRADVHWVWTEFFAESLREAGQSNRIECVGPITFYPPAPVAGLPDGPKIAIFDVTPLADGKRVFGSAENYYSTASMKRFIADIVSVAHELSEARGEKIWCLLKHKREPLAGFHDGEYPNFIDEMRKDYPLLKLIDTDTNLFGLLDACDTSVAFPYTTTCVAASLMGKPSLYYDPMGVLVPRVDPSPAIGFAATRDELKRQIESALPAA